jgi:hypothetical protein
MLVGYLYYWKSEPNAKKIKKVSRCTSFILLACDLMGGVM